MSSVVTIATDAHGDKLNKATHKHKWVNALYREHLSSWL